MKKLALLFAVIPMLFSCTKTPVELELKSYVETRSKPDDVKYKLIEYHIVDTITNSEAIDSISSELFIASLDSSTFRKYRNQEFEVFRSRYPEYEQKVLFGELKDASQWCTEIRLITEKADSILSNWNDGLKYSYDYSYLTAWYIKRMYHFYKTSYNDMDKSEKLLNSVVKNKDKYFTIDELSKLNKEDVYEYRVSHKFSFVNPIIGKRIELNELVTLDENMKFKSYESVGNIIEDIIKQLK